jgi:hypothetical protein
MSVSVATVPSSLVVGRSFARSRPIEQPPRFGEKPYVQLVHDAFDGANLTWSRRLKLLEEADARKIRRGDALDVIKSTQRRRDRQFKVTRPSRLRAFVTRYAIFAAAYIALAMVWCAVLALH